MQPFGCGVPQEVDLLLLQWNIAYMQLERAETSFEAAGLLKRPEHNLRCCGCTGLLLLEMLKAFCQDNLSA